MNAETHAAQPRLMHLPVSLFAMVMGLSGLTLATLRFEHASGAAGAASPYLLGLTVLVFIGIAGLYLTKLVRHPAAVKAEWHHPVRLAFFPAISISLVLIATAAMAVSPDLALPVWALGTALQLAATLAVVSSWIGHRPFEAAHLNPAWFIPAVGNVLVPLAGVRLGYVEVSWFFFATGMMFWIILLTLVFNRLVFHAQLPDRLMPTLMILVAPPAVGYLSYSQLSPGLDAFSRILFYAAVLFALVVLTQLPRLVKLPFMISWWAYSFPVAALTAAAFAYGEAAAAPGIVMAAKGLYVVLAVLIVMLAGRTARAAMNGEICKPET